MKMAKRKLSPESPHSGSIHSSKRRKVNNILDTGQVHEKPRRNKDAANVSKLPSKKIHTASNNVMSSALVKPEKPVNYIGLEKKENGSMLSHKSSSSRKHHPTLANSGGKLVKWNTQQVTSSSTEQRRGTKGDVHLLKDKKRKQGSCMKHKKKDKIHHKQRKKSKQDKEPHDSGSGEKTVDSNTGSSLTPIEIKAVHTLPRNPEEFSSNWKQLQKTFLSQDHREKQSTRKVKEWQKKHNHKQKAKATKIAKKPQPDHGVPDNLKSESKAPDIWFDDVDEVLIESSKPKSVVGPGTEADTLAGQWDSVRNPLVKPTSYGGLTRIVAMDCEMVGVGPEGRDSMLARVSIVNQYGQCVYDQYVQATEPVTDYRTQFSGIHPGDLEKGEPFKTVQKQVDSIIRGRILVGHAIHNDLQVLFLDHPHKKIRDTSRYRGFRKLVQGGTPSLKKLSEAVLGVQVQKGEHNSVQDAQATMRLYTMFRKQWEKEIKLQRSSKKVVTTSATP